MRLRRVIILLGIVLPLLAAMTWACPYVQRGDTAPGLAHEQWRAGAADSTLWATLPASAMKLPDGLTTGRDGGSAPRDDRLVVSPATWSRRAGAMPPRAGMIATRRPAWVGVVEIRI